ncbi:MAG: hypothetical protein MUE46_09985 [Xanthomonadales bacterium]|jgi:hypothetical protein|nr:hypothetical protein [Xanthomonadales bacterium]
MHFARTLALLIFACLPSIAGAVSPEQIERHLVGTWLVVFEAEDGQHEIVMSYGSDGAASMQMRAGVSRRPGSGTVNSLTGKYRIVADGIETTTLTSSDAERFPVGDVTTDRVVEIDDEQMKVEAEGSALTAIRVSAAPGDPSCLTGSKTAPCVRALLDVQPEMRESMAVKPAGSAVRSPDGKLQARVPTAYWRQVDGVAEDVLSLMLVPASQLSIARQGTAAFEGQPQMAAQFRNDARFETVQTTEALEISSAGDQPWRVRIDELNIVGSNANLALIEAEIDGAVRAFGVATTSASAGDLDDLLALLKTVEAGDVPKRSQ